MHRTVNLERKKQSVLLLHIALLLFLLAGSNTFAGTKSKVPDDWHRYRRSWYVGKKAYYLGYKGVDLVHHEVKGKNKLHKLKWGHNRVNAPKARKDILAVVVEKYKCAPEFNMELVDQVDKGDKIDTVLRELHLYEISKDGDQQNLFFVGTITGVYVYLSPGALFYGTARHEQGKTKVLCLSNIKVKKPDDYYYEHCDALLCNINGIPSAIIEYIFNGGTSGGRADVGLTHIFNLEKLSAPKEIFKTRTLENFTSRDNYNGERLIKRTKLTLHHGKTETNTLLIDAKVQIFRFAITGEDESQEVGNVHVTNTYAQEGDTFVVHNRDYVKQSAKEQYRKKQKSETWFGITKTPNPGQSFTNSLGQRLVWIPKGNFYMGLKLPPPHPQTWPNYDPYESAAERPGHQRTIKHGYWIAAWETTKEEAALLVQADKVAPAQRNMPVLSSWSHAMAFCNELNERERKLGQLPPGYEYCLPTEAQWEYACRAGTKGNYHPQVDLICWHSENSGYKLHPVAQRPANKFGLYDMLGNQSEWCLDEYRLDYKNSPKDERPYIAAATLAKAKQFKASAGNEFVATMNKPSTYCRQQMARGGSYLHSVGFCRVGKRYHGGPVGFRVVLSRPLPAHIK